MRTRSRGEHFRSRPSATVHGELVEVFGNGVLILGPSGIGKTECAFALTDRGHSLVADDCVTLRRKGGSVYGNAPTYISGHAFRRAQGFIKIRPRHSVQVTLIVDAVRTDREGDAPTLRRLLVETARGGTDTRVREARFSNVQRLAAQIETYVLENVD